MQLSRSVRLATGIGAGVARAVAVVGSASSHIVVEREVTAPGQGAS